MARIHLITFGGGGRRYRAAARRVVRQSRGFPEIVTATAFGPEDLDAGYHALFPDFATRYPRGFGLWSWKPYLIHHAFQNLTDGEILFYADAGCELNPAATERFNDYIDWIDQHGALLFQMGLKNRTYTKSDPRLIPNDAFLDRGQYAATIIFLRKTPEMTAFLDEWLALCAENDGELLKDVDPATQREGFVDHRHDQSVLNAVAYKHHLPALPDETVVAGPFGLKLRSYAREVIKFPVHSMRNRGGIASMPLIKFVSRL